MLFMIQIWMLFSVLYAQEPRQSAQEIISVSKKIQKLINKKSIAGAISMVYWKGEVVHYRAQGMRDIQEKSALQKDSLMRIYSMTKPITSVSVMILQEQKKLNLDDSIVQYLPEFRNVEVYKRKGGIPLQRDITIRDLLRHTSGFSYGFFSSTPVDAMYRKKHPLYSVSNREMTKKLSQYPLLFQPGERWHYSLSTDVLGALVERVSGMSLGEFFHKHIIEPLDMNDTSFYVPKEKLQRFSSSYKKKNKIHERYTKSYFLQKDRIESGGGGLVSTASDYMRFCQMLLGKGEWEGVRIISEESIREMTTNQLPKDVFAYGYFGFGLGFQIQLYDWGNKGHIGEYGWDGAASTHFWISPKDDLIVILLSQKQPYSNQLKEQIKPLIYQYMTD